MENSNNPFEKITAFFDGIPAPKSDLTLAALAEIRQIFREERADEPAKSGENIPISISGTQEWLDAMRNQFRTQTDEVKKLQAEFPDLNEFTRMLVFQFRMGEPPNKNLIDLAARLSDYLSKSEKALSESRRLMAMVLSVMSEHSDIS